MPHEGERIKTLLSSIGKTPADLARAADVTRTAVDRYLKAGTVGPIAWTTVRAGLLKLGIDPRKIKPDDAIKEVVDLRPLVEDFSRDQLARIRKILEEDGLAREKLAYFIDGVLQPRK